MQTGMHYPINLDAMPALWETGYVGDFALVIQPGFASGKHNKEGRGIPHLRPYNIDRLGKLDLSEIKSVASDADRKRLHSGDVLFNNTNSPELIGKTSVIAVAGDWGFSNHMTRVAFSDAVSPKFAAYQLHYLWMQGYFLHNCVKHVNQASVSSTTLARTVPFVKPPRPQQEDIVAEIEKQFSRLDEAVANLRRVKANLKRYKAAVLKAAVEGKLTEDWRKRHPDIEPASKLLERILTERRAKFAQKKDSFLTAEGAPSALCPDGWSICSIDQIAECLDAKRLPVNKSERAKRGGNIPYYGANGQVGVIDDYIFNEPLVLVVEDETFTGRTQAFSYLIRGKSWVNNHAHVLRATAAVTASYLNYGLAFYPFIPRTTGSTGRRKLTQKGLMTAPFLLPPFVEQEQIVAEV